MGSVSFTANGVSYSWIEQMDQTASTANTFLLMYIYTSTAGTYHFNVSNASSPWLIPAKELFITFQAPVPFTTNTPFTLTNTTAISGLYFPHSIAAYSGTVFEPANVFNASEIGDFATITLTAIHDNRADGNFTAKLTRMSDTSVVNITNGAFKNVEIMP